MNSSAGGSRAISAQMNAHRQAQQNRRTQAERALHQRKRNQRQRVAQDEIGCAQGRGEQAGEESAAPVLRNEQTGEHGEEGLREDGGGGRKILQAEDVHAGTVADGGHQEEERQRKPCAEDEAQRVAQQLFQAAFGEDQRFFHTSASSPAARATNASSSEQVCVASVSSCTVPTAFNRPLDITPMRSDSASASSM